MRYVLRYVTARLVLRGLLIVGALIGAALAGTDGLQALAEAAR